MADEAFIILKKSPPFWGEIGDAFFWGKIFARQKRGEVSKEVGVSTPEELSGKKTGLGFKKGKKYLGSFEVSSFKPKGEKLGQRWARLGLRVK